MNKTGAKTQQSGAKMNPYPPASVSEF